MPNSQLITAQLEDGTYVAAATGEPYFCTIGQDQDSVLSRAHEAARFYKETVQAISAPPASSVRVQFTHERVVPESAEAWLADKELRAST